MRSNDLTPLRSRAEYQRSQVVSFIRACPEILDAKGQDYADPQNAFSNFELVGAMLDEAVRGGMAHADLSFLALIMTKIVRIMNLRAQRAAPCNESLTDTFRDLINYCGLWAQHIAQKREEKEEKILTELVREPNRT